MKKKTMRTVNTHNQVIELLIDLNAYTNYCATSQRYTYTPRIGYLSGTAVIWSLLVTPAGEGPKLSKS